MASGDAMSGISTLEKLKSRFPSRAKRARWRTESLSPKFLSSMEDSGRDTPIKPADSVRVETEERRLWWELRLEESRAGREGAEDEKERELGRDCGRSCESLLRT